MGSCFSNESEFSVQQEKCEQTQKRNDANDTGGFRRLVCTKENNDEELIEKITGSGAMSKENKCALDSTCIHLKFGENNIINHYSNQMAFKIIAEAQSESTSKPP